MAHKNRLEDLAVFGGEPAFTEPLHVGRPNIGNREVLLERINELLDRRWLTNQGPYVIDFERRICDLLGVRNCIAMCNATVALEIAIRACGMTGEVIIPSFTFIATAHALQWQEITPVFCDIEPHSQNIDPSAVEALITPRTSGIIGVHLWGRACDVDALADIARRHNLKLLFDAAHAFACSYKGRMIGSFGNAEVLSFHATKFLNTFEGGAVVTNDDELAGKVRLMQNFGFAGYDKVTQIGTNGKMSEVSAAMGLTALESMKDFIAANAQNYRQYEEEISGIPGLRIVTYDETEQCNYQYIVLEVDEALTQVSRDQLVEVLWAENIRGRRYFYPGCHRMEPYRSLFPGAGLLLPHTERLAERVLCLPTGTTIGHEAVRTICHVIRMSVASGKEVSEKIQDSINRATRAY